MDNLEEAQLLLESLRGKIEKLLKGKEVSRHVAQCLDNAIRGLIDAQEMEVDEKSNLIMSD